MAEDQAEETTKAPGQVREVEEVASELPNVYANNATIRLTVWDVRFGFGLVEDVTDEKATVRTIVNVLMSPQHAKFLGEVIREKIDEYETKWGKIPQPERLDR